MTFSKTTYNGGGNIDRLWMGFSNSLYGYATAATVGTLCVNGPSSASPRQSWSSQGEASGAAHTIYGYAGDSPNHTNCWNL